MMAWEPLPDGPHKMLDWYGGGLVVLASTGSTLDVYDSTGRATVDLPDNIRLCRLVEDAPAAPAAPAAPDEVRAGEEAQEAGNEPGA